MNYLCVNMTLNKVDARLRGIPLRKFDRAFHVSL